MPTMPTEDPKQASPDDPTWDEVARLRRNNRRLAAELRIANEEAQEVTEARAALAAHKEELADARKERGEAKRRYGEVTAELRMARESRVSLEHQVGEVEARLARALGRTLVMEKEGEIAELGAALWAAYQLCLVEVPYPPARTVDDMLGFGRNADNSPGMSRLRQVRDVLNRACAAFGIREDQAKAKAAK